jgi:hypothetical protein
MVFTRCLESKLDEGKHYLESILCKRSKVKYLDERRGGWELSGSFKHQSTTTR